MDNNVRKENMSETQAAVQPEASGNPTDVELALCHNPQSKLWQEAAQLEAQVFMSSRYVANADELFQAYAQYEPRTRMLATIKNGKVVGAMRVINYDPNVGLKTLNDSKNGLLTLSAEGQALLRETDPNQVVEVGTIALDEEYRGKTEDEAYMISSLYGGIYSLTLQENTPNIIASFDEDYYERFVKLFGPSVTALGPPTDYMGSKTVPVLMNVERLKEYFISINAEPYVDSLIAHGANMKNEY